MEDFLERSWNLADWTNYWMEELKEDLGRISTKKKYIKKEETAKLSNDIQ